MKQAGQIALMPFPFTDLSSAKRRPVLLLRQLDQRYDDWLVCMISSQCHQYHPQLDWLINQQDEAFAESGLKVSSVIRLSRIAVLDGQLLLGQLGSISDTRLSELRTRLSHWLIEPQTQTAQPLV